MEASSSASGGLDQVLPGAAEKDSDPERGDGGADSDPLSEMVWRSGGIAAIERGAGECCLLRAAMRLMSLADARSRDLLRCEDLDA